MTPDVDIVLAGIETIRDAYLAEGKEDRAMVLTRALDSLRKSPLLPDDDTAVERLAAALDAANFGVNDGGFDNGRPIRNLERAIAALREGGQR